MREVVDLLVGIVKAVRCSGCHGTYGRGDVSVFSIFGAYWILKCVCRTCDTQRVVVAVVRDGEAFVPGETSPPPLVSDDVLDVHEWLRDYNGDITGLFKR